MASTRGLYRANYTSVDLRAAANFVVQGAPCRTIAAERGIPPSTLRGVVKAGAVADKLGRKRLMLPHEEARLAQYMVDRCNANCPVPISVAGVVAAEILKLRGVAFATENALPSSQWW